MTTNRQKGSKGKASRKQQKLELEQKKKKAEEEVEEESSDEESSSSEEKNNKSDQDSSSSSSSDDSSSDDDSTNEGKQSNSFFTDENAAWLKPKAKQKSASKLLASSDEESGSDDDSDDRGEAEDSEEEEDLLEIEKESRLIDEEMEVEKEEAEEEMRRTVSQNTSIYHLPTAKELEKDIDRVVPPSEIRSHIDSILEVLSEFKDRREPGRSRKEYVDQLGAFIAELHGYLPELVEYFLTMFGPAETVEFVKASDSPRPMVVRTNTLKARRKDLAASLIKRGVSLDPLASWSKVGLKIVESPVPIGATPEYLSGMYMLQSAASMCPVLALGPEPKERVLDMSAAPGGKTSYMAQLMRNTGYILANDLKPDRQKATVANMHRLGVKNVIACAHDGRKMGKLFHNRFDRILLDAPCSGLGVISRDPSVKVQRTLADVNQTAHLQKELLLSAIDALKVSKPNGTAGVMVYSTCSVSVAENEQVVEYALKKRDIKIIETGLDFGRPGFTRYQERRFHHTMALTRRFYPHVHNMDGFFVCKIRKLSDKRPGDDTKTNEKVDEPIKQKVQDDASAKKTKKRSKDGDKSAEKLQKKRKQQDKASAKPSNRSVPPQNVANKKSKKQRTNAKVTKPRRLKVQ